MLFVVIDPVRILEDIINFLVVLGVERVDDSNVIDGVGDPLEVERRYLESEIGWLVDPL